jgi:hypothetical protein
MCCRMMHRGRLTINVICQILRVNIRIFSMNRIKGHTVYPIDTYIHVTLSGSDFTIWKQNFILKKCL